MMRFIARLYKKQQQRLYNFLKREKAVKESWKQDIFLKHKAHKSHYILTNLDTVETAMQTGCCNTIRVGFKNFTPFLWELNKGRTWTRISLVPEPHNNHLIQDKWQSLPWTQMLLCSGLNLKTGFSPVQFTWRVQKAYFSFQQRINTNVRSCQGTDCHPPTASLPSNTWRILYFAYRLLILCSGIGFLICARCICTKSENAE